MRAQDRDQLIAVLAARQHGVISTRQLLAAGLSRDEISTRTRRGLLHALHRGVHGVGHAATGTEGRWMAGVLSGGAGAVLCSWSAGARWEIARDDPTRVHVATSRRLHDRRGLAFHELPLSPALTTTRRGIPVLKPAHTLVDLATVMNPRQLQRAVHEAEVRRLCRPAQVRAALLARPRTRGSAALRSILDMAEGRGLPTRSEFEDRFLRFLERHSLPLPLTNARVETPRGGFEVDCYWPDQRLVVELDGTRFHTGGIAQARDARKDRALLAAGLRVSHITWFDLADREDELAVDVRTALRVGPARG